MLTLAGNDFDANAILWRVVHNLPTSNRKDKKKMRWVRVMDALGTGSSVSIAACLAFDLDPDEYI